MIRYGLFLMCFLQTTLASTKDIRLKDPEIRNQLIREASVWEVREPLSPDQIFNGPKITPQYPKYVSYFLNDNVYCETNEDDQLRFKKGRTHKFYCQLMTPRQDYVTKKKGGRRVIKVKYNPPGKENLEIESEIIGTRLLWALGFYADHMFYVNNVHCYGCTSNPFEDRIVDTSSLKQPRVFSEAAIEYKLDADKIKILKTSTREADSYWDSGILFKEIMDYLPNRERGKTYPRHKDGGGLRLNEMLKYMKPQQHVWATQFAQRDALRLLASFMNHVDMKSDNHRFVCLKKQQGKCVKPAMMIHDIGSSFGVRINFKKVGFERVNLKVWKKRPIWKNPKKCRVRFSNDLLISLGASARFDITQSNAQISEAGRHFLIELLDDFTANKDRVRALFRAARMSEDEVEAWTGVFMDKVEQIRYPMGRENPNFRCRPTRFESRPKSWN